MYAYRADIWLESQHFKAKSYVFLPASTLYLFAVKSSNVQLATALPNARSLFQILKPDRANAISNVLEFFSFPITEQRG
jgi:hypothetical protein